MFTLVQESITVRAPSSLTDAEADRLGDEVSDALASLLGAVTANLQDRFPHLTIESTS